MKTCKQCKRTLALDNFRVVKSRSTGKRASTPGVRSVCKYCENMNTQAHNLLRDIEAGRHIDEEKLVRVREYYLMLVNAGYTLVHSAPKRLLGISTAASLHRHHKPPQHPGGVVVTRDMLYSHIQKLRDRAYDSFDAAEAAHKCFNKALREAGLYEEANNLIDEWFEED